MYAVGDLKFGLIPPIPAAAPLSPPLLSRQGAVGHIVEPANGGYLNPKGGLLLLPWMKTGGVELPLKKVGMIRPGGFPRNSSWTFCLGKPIGIDSGSATQDPVALS